MHVSLWYRSVSVILCRGLVGIRFIRSTLNRLQVRNCVDTRGHPKHRFVKRVYTKTQHVDAVLLPSPTPQSATTIGHSGALPTVHQDNNGIARIPLHSTSHLEVAAKDSSQQ